MTDFTKYGDAWTLLKKIGNVHMFRRTGKNGDRFEVFRVRRSMFRGKETESIPWSHWGSEGKTFGPIPPGGSEDIPCGLQDRAERFFGVLVAREAKRGQKA